MNYVDGFILAVPMAKMADYKKLAKKACKVWLKHGALSYVECVADDAPVGKLTSFPRAVKLDMANLPFDAKRMIFGGFKMIVES